MPRLHFVSAETGSIIVCRLAQSAPPGSLGSTRRMNAYRIRMISTIARELCRVSLSRGCDSDAAPLAHYRSRVIPALGSVSLRGRNERYFRVTRQRARSDQWTAPDANRELSARWHCQPRPSLSGRIAVRARRSHIAGPQKPHKDRTPGHRPRFGVAGADPRPEASPQCRSPPGGDRSAAARRERTRY
jgi:hypothetical protein